MEIIQERKCIVNPIYKEYYSHLDCETYKIDLPWPQFATETQVLCPVKEGYDHARRLAIGALCQHIQKITEKENG